MIQRTDTRAVSVLTAPVVHAWLTTYLARLLGITSTSIDPAHSFESYGIDSSGAVGLSGDLGDLLGREFDTSLAYDYATIDALVAHLVASGIVAPD